MSDPVNNGMKIYTLLVEYSTLTGQPTGRTKPNIPSDLDYIAPVEDLTSCPLPGGGGQTMDIEVVIPGGFTVVCRILFGQGSLSRSTSGTWTVPLRTYDSVIFDVQVIATNRYRLKVYYGTNQIKDVAVVDVGQIFIQGPFPVITKLEIVPVIGGDFNDDWSDDFLNQ